MSNSVQSSQGNRIAAEVTNWLQRNDHLHREFLGVFRSVDRALPSDRGDILTAVTFGLALPYRIHRPFKHLFNNMKIEIYTAAAAPPVSSGRE